MIITIRIRRMGEGNTFSLLVCPHRGVPTLTGGYLPWPGPDGGYLPWWVPTPARSRWGTYPGQVQTGGTYPGWGIPTLVGTTPLARVGTPMARVGTPNQSRYPPSQGRYPPARVGTPSPTRTDQHSEHLLRDGWYASCVHARGLFCEMYVLSWWNTNTSLSLATSNRVFLSTRISEYGVTGGFAFGPVLLAYLERCMARN